MRKILAAVIALFALAGAAQAKGKTMPKNYRMVPFTQAQILQKGENKMYCTRCGMTLPMFYRTNHAATVDGHVEQFCSMYCLIEAMQHSKSVTDVKVVDNTTLVFIPVEKAFYVVGSSKPATMAKKVSKYAFGTAEAAKEFAEKFGGKVMRYPEALSQAKEAFIGDTEAKKMRQDKGAQKGEMIYKKKCKPIEKRFHSVAQIKAYITANKVCGDLKGKSLQTVGLYLIKNQE